MSAVKVPYLTERQIRHLEYTLQGKRHAEIADLMGMTVHAVQSEAVRITQKFGAKSSVQAMHIYTTAKAYREASNYLRAAKIPAPVGDKDKHVNHVLDGLADLFMQWHDFRMPK